MKITETERIEKIAQMNATKSNMRALVAQHEANIDRSPAETVAEFVEKIGYVASCETVAELVNTVGDWDARVSSNLRKWALEQPTAASRQELDSIGVYQPAEIHPAHIAQIAEAMMPYTPDQEEPPRSSEEIVADIISFFENNDEVFEQCAEELDGWNGFLGDDRFYEMEELDNVFSGEDISRILERAFFGYDAETWDTDSNGCRTYGAFNPNRTYFHFNAYGNLVSSNYKDYSDHLDEYFVKALFENRREIDTIESCEELSGLFYELETA